MNPYKCASKIGKTIFSLTIVLSVLKIIGIIHWSLIWILTPIWLPIILFIGLGIAVTILNKDIVKED